MLTVQSEDLSTKKPALESNGNVKKLAEQFEEKETIVSTPDKNIEEMEGVEVEADESSRDEKRESSSSSRSSSRSRSP